MVLCRQIPGYGSKCSGQQWRKLKCGTIGLQFAVLHFVVNRKPKKPATCPRGRTSDTAGRTVVTSDCNLSYLLLEGQFFSLSTYVVVTTHSRVSLEVAVEVVPRF